MKRARSLKLIGVVSAMLAVLVGASVVYGGLRWSGFDPIVNVDGVKYSLNVAVPPDKWCDIARPISVKFYVPRGAQTELVEEFVGGEEFCGVTTETSFQKHPLLRKVFVSVRIPARGRFPVDVMLTSGESEQVCSGSSNRPIVCSLNDDDHSRPAVGRRLPHPPRPQAD